MNRATDLAGTVLAGLVMLFARPLLRIIYGADWEARP